MSFTPSTTAWPSNEHLSNAVGMRVTEIGFPGAIALVSAPDRETWMASFGVGDRAAGTPMTVAMHTRVGSITKMFTATIVLQLVDEGKLSLDDTLSSLIPDAADLPHAERITLRQMLNMRSGIFNYTEDELTFSTLVVDPNRIWTQPELIDIARKHDAYFEPGSTFHYSNTNYILLEMIVERTTGRPFEEELQERILTPLGLAETFLPTSPAMPEPFAHGYGRDPALPRPTKADAAKAQDVEKEAVSPPPMADPSEIIDTTVIPPSIAAGAGALVSTVADLDRWLHALIDGVPLSVALQRERMMLRPTGEDGFLYGLGVMTHGRLIGHAGGIPGYTSFAGHDPASGANIVVLANGEGNGTPEGTVIALVDTIVALLPTETTST
jgi:D-alanyl-D-alanine carboxypeptidase